MLIPRLPVPGDFADVFGDEVVFVTAPGEKFFGDGSQGDKPHPNVVQRHQGKHHADLQQVFPFLAVVKQDAQLHQFHH